MDFTSFATIEFAHAFEAEREYERGQRKWLIQWLDLSRAADARNAAAKAAEAAVPRLAA